MRLITPLLAALALIAAPAAWAADANKPHEHKGVLKPYKQPPPPVSLTAKDQAALGKGEPVMKTLEGESGGRGAAVFRVNAPPDVVWGVISDFKSYPKWIDNVEEIEVYKTTPSTKDVRFELSAIGFSVEYFIHHMYGQADDTYWCTWTLDYARNSDLDDSVGSWRVSPVAQSPGQSQVEYSVDLRVKGWVPGFIRSLLVDKGLKEATQWVKVQSEKRVKK